MATSTRNWLLGALVLVLGGLAFALTGSGAEADVRRTPAQTAKLVFTALKSGDAEAFRELLPSEEALTAVLNAELEKLATEKRGTAKAGLETAGGFGAVVAKRKREALQWFERARTEAAEAFDWKDAAFVGIDESQLVERDGGLFKALRVAFLVRVGEQLHEFKVHKVRLVEGRWCPLDGVSYRGVAGGDAQAQIQYLETTVQSLRSEVATLEKQNDELSLGITRHNQDALREMQREMDVRGTPARGVAGRPCAADHGAREDARRRDREAARGARAVGGHQALSRFA